MTREELVEAYGPRAIELASQMLECTEQAGADIVQQEAQARGQVAVLGPKWTLEDLDDTQLHGLIRSAKLMLSRGYVQ